MTVKRTPIAYRIEPVTKEQQGRSQYMALVAPNGKVIGMFYEPNIAKTLLGKINNHDELIEALNDVLLIFNDFEDTLQCSDTQLATYVDPIRNTLEQALAEAKG